MFWALLGLTALLLAAWAAEKSIHDRDQGTFRAVIHVNGVRGKTSTSRLLDAALRSRYRVFTKTTGTDAAWIGTDGAVHPIRRWGPPNIREQLRMLRLARRQGAEVVILECMAVQPDLQRVCQERIVQSGITVITNVRRDHMFELGEDSEEITRAFSATVPENGTLYTGDELAAEQMAPYCREKNCALIQCGTAGGPEENRAIALALAARLGVPREEAEAGIQTCYQQDFGAQREYSLPGGGAFLNLFSVNDPDSSRLDLEAVRSGRTLAFLFNHRQDRPDRLLLFCRHFFPRYPGAPIYCTGGGEHLLRRFLTGESRAIIPLRRWRDCLDSAAEGTLLVGVGSIKGAGRAIVQALEEGEG